MLLVKLLVTIVLAASNGVNAKRVVFSGCSTTQCPVQSNNLDRKSCLMVRGFGDRDFAGNGIYCQTQENDCIYSLDNYFHKTLRYELRSNDDGFGQWQLFRAVSTKRSWVELPIYFGVPTGKVQTPTQPHELKWSALSLENTEPAIEVSVYDVPAAFLKIRELLHHFRSGKVDSCQLSVCDAILSPMLFNDTNTELCFSAALLSASLASHAGYEKLSANRLDKARACKRDAINAMVSKSKNELSIPRSLRWEIAETSYQMARSYVKAGMLQAAIDATLVALASSPLPRQRRMLYVNLGDLRLAVKETKAAYSAYVHALKAVRQHGGAVDKDNFLQLFEDSVGDFIGQVVANNNRSSDLALAIPNNYAKIRVILILHAEKDDGIYDLPEFTSSANPLTSFGRECELDETPFEFCNGVKLPQTAPL